MRVRSAIPFFLMAASGAAQSLRIDTQPVRAGEAGTASIRLESPAALKPLTAIQWNLLFPARNIAFEAKPMVAGDAARSAGKTLVCSGKDQGGQSYLFRCILAGGVQPMRSGTLATLTFKVAPEAKAGDYPVRLEHAMATDTAAAAVTIPDYTAKLTVKR